MNQLRTYRTIDAARRVIVPPGADNPVTDLQNVVRNVMRYYQYSPELVRPVSVNRVSFIAQPSAYTRRKFYPTIASVDNISSLLEDAVADIPTASRALQNVHGAYSQSSDRQKKNEEDTEELFSVVFDDEILVEERDILMASLEPYYAGVHALAARTPRMKICTIPLGNNYMAREDIIHEINGRLQSMPLNLGRLAIEVSDHLV